MQNFKIPGKKRQELEDFKVFLRDNGTSTRGS